MSITFMKYIVLTTIVFMLVAQQMLLNDFNNINQIVIIHNQENTILKFMRPLEQTAVLITLYSM